MHQSSAYLREFRPNFSHPSAADLCTETPSITADATNAQVMEIFNLHRDLVSLPVLEEDQPIGLINRNIFLSQMSKQFRMELYGRKSCIAFMDKEPLIVDAAIDIETLTFKTVEYGEKALTDGFIITKNGVFAGISNGLHLMRVVAEMQASRNRQIMHSIEYASVIQQSMLRISSDALKTTCAQSHIVWEPRDIVGGDFYQFRKHVNGWLATVADCTGHGVPGAFMTLIASTTLNQAIDTHGLQDPARLLSSVNRSIKQMLGQIDGKDATPGSDDGMDAACFWFEPANGRLVFAGARLALFILRPEADNVELLEGGRKGVGYVDSGLDYEWKNQELLLPSGTTVFVTTDGLIDQIGGPRAIAFGKRRIRDLLISKRAMAPEQLSEAILLALREWQGIHHRRDDVTFFSFRT